MIPCPTCYARTTEDIGRFVKQKPFQVFTADTSGDKIRTRCQSCRKVVGYRPIEVKTAGKDKYDGRSDS